MQSIGKMNTPIINALLALIIHAVIMVLGMVYLAPEWGLYCYAGSSVIYASSYVSLMEFPCVSI